MKIKDIPKIIKMQRKINSLENQIETLENIIKNELYEEFIKKINEIEEIEKIKKENKRLRIKIKDLKEIIKGED